MQVRRHYSGAPWERRVGYCRALRIGPQIWVTGTAPIDEHGRTYEPGNPTAQARRCIELLGEALAGVDASLEHVVRTRIFVTDITMWQAFGVAHHEAFKDHNPTTTMVEVSRLIEPDMLLEIEADAYVI